jgi:hypothetical protein
MKEVTVAGIMEFYYYICKNSEEIICSVWHDIIFDAVTK